MSNKNIIEQGKVSQLTDLLLMIVPSMFGLNPETNTDNVFQPKSITENEEEITAAAMAEFDQMVQQLRSENIQIVVCPSREDSGIITPDAVFPNNWVSFHSDQIVIYPMKAPNRRAERQLGNVQKALKNSGFLTEGTTLDLSSLENKGQILEGTGSLVLERNQKVGFASLSERTTSSALKEFSQQAGYEIVSFNSVDRNGVPIYHTNVVMSIGEGFAVICADAIQDKNEKQTVLQRLRQLGKEIIEISHDQLHDFCGNILQVKSTDGLTKIIMSKTAYDAFTKEQRGKLSQHGKLLVVTIPTIERIGGGSARCMLAEVFGADLDG